MRRRWTPVLAAALLSLAGCSLLPDWLSSDDEAPLPGERVSVLELATSLEPDPELAGTPVALPDPTPNPDWPQTGDLPTHAPGHLALAIPFSRVWSTDIGKGSSGDERLLSPPIMADGRIFATDAAGDVVALSTDNGRELWRVRAASPYEDSDPLGGGVAYDNNLVYATTGFGEVLALDPANGGRVWREQGSGPMRAAPGVAEGRVFVISIDNQLDAYKADTGEVLYTHTGILEPAGLLGGASPAIGAGVVVVPYSSGEIFALRQETGRPAWSDSLTATRRVGALASLADIRGAPVIDRDRVFAASHSGRMVALDLRSGDRVWEQPIASVDMPWVAGNTVFVLTTDNQVIALNRDDGRVRWVRQLDRWKNPNSRRDPIVWAGPVLAGGQLILVGTTGQGVLISPETGEIASTFKLEGPTTIPPIVANGTLYVLSDDGTLTAYR